MSKIYTSVDELVGNTPLVEVGNLEKELNLEARLLVKVEALNPAGSVKDRVALEMLNQAESDGKLVAGSTIIEPTSGNTGIGLTALAIRRGYKVIIVMPDTMSVERRNLMKAYGATVELTPGKLGMKGAIARAEELNKEIPNSFIPGQFVNMANPEAHYKTTGPEIWNDTEGNVDYFVAGVGTGGTISGTAKFLKEQKPSVKAIAVEPESSPVLSLGTAGPHKIQGIGAGFIPATLNTKIYDEVVRVSNEASFETARLLARREGLLTGISSGAALSVGIELAKKPENKGKTIVVLLPDSGDRYLSNELYNFGE
jgi:cysteine synthase A